MLVIRDEQLKTFQDIAEDNFVQRVMKHLREEQIEETFGLDDERLKKRVVFAVEKARSYDLTWEKPIVLFVKWMFVISPNFDEQKNIKLYLEASRDHQNEDLQYLPDFTSDEDWQEAEDSFDDSVWEAAEAETLPG